MFLMSRFFLVNQQHTWRLVLSDSRMNAGCFKLESRVHDFFTELISTEQ